MRTLKHVLGLLTASVSVLLVVLLIGCNSSGSELTSYFESLASIQVDDATSATLRQQFEARMNDSTERDSVQAVADFIEGMVPLTKEVLSDYDRIEVPPIAQRDHSLFVTAFGELIEAHERAAARVRSVDTLLEARRIIEAEVAASQAKLDRACEGLQALADARSVPIELGCHSVGLPATALVGNRFATFIPHAVSPTRLKCGASADTAPRGAR